MGHTAGVKKSNPSSSSSLLFPTQSTAALMATIPITGTSISALTTNPQHTQIFYQTLDRAATQSVLNGGTWEQKQLPWFPVTLSPLASASDGEKEVSRAPLFPVFRLMNVSIDPCVLS